MKIFLDTADTEIIEKHFGSGLIDGITTNPSLIMKSGRDPEEVYQELKDLGIDDISMEVMGDSSNMIVEGRRLASKFGKCATIKVPCTYEGLIACRQLSRELIRVNVTLIFDVAQAILAAKAGATYVSPFVGRLDDIGEKGMDLISDIVIMYENYGFDTEVLVASVRNTQHLIDAAVIGAHVSTLPPKVIYELYKHPLTDKGLKAFLDDWAKTGQQILPK